jgi:hypothetical protein
LEEGFMNSFKFIQSLKLRASYGLSGNLGPNASALLNLSSDLSIRPTDNETYLLIKDLTNRQLTWEKLKELNIGLDYSLFQGRISGLFNYYVRSSFDLIGEVQTSGIGGEGLKFGNFANMKSRGIEISISSVNYKNDNFSWTTDFNLGYNTEEITKLDIGPRLVDAISQGGSAVLGGPRRGLYSTQFAGLDNQGFPLFYTNNEGETVYDIDLQQRADLKEILVYEGSIDPLGSGGLTNTLNYKGFSLRIFFSFKFHYKIRLNNLLPARGEFNDFRAIPEDLNDRWATSGDENLTNIPAILDAAASQTVSNVENSYNLYNKSNIRVANGDYLRLKTLRLSYNLPNTFIKRYGLNNMTVALEGQNLALLYKDKALDGQDPEFFGTGGVALPQPRVITFSLNVGF